MGARPNLVQREERGARESQRLSVSAMPGEQMIDVDGLKEAKHVLLELGGPAVMEPRVHRPVDDVVRRHVAEPASDIGGALLAFPALRRRQRAEIRRSRFRGYVFRTEPLAPHGAGASAFRASSTRSGIVPTSRPSTDTTNS